MQKMQEEQERAEARREAQQAMSGAPFRFFTPVGETREIVIVDEAPDFFRHEHNLKDGQGKWRVFTSCIAEHANCPVCMSNPDKAAYFAMYLTIIDLTPYVNSDNIEVPWSKKLLVVKPAQQKKIMRLYERLGTLRGTVLAMTRDGDKDASIGNDIEHVDTLSEGQLAEYYNTYVDKHNKQIEVIGGEPYDYDAIMPAQTEEQLAAIVGGHSNSYGSHASNAGLPRSRPGSRAPSQGTGDGWQDDAPPARGPAARPGARPAGRPAPRMAEPEAGAEETPGGEYEEEPAPAPQRPAPRGLARGPAPSTPPQRPAPRGPAPAAAPQRPAAPQQSLAARRAALRGG